MELENYIKKNLTAEQKAFFQFLKKSGVENLLIKNYSSDKNISQLIERHRLVPFFFVNKKHLHAGLHEYITRRFIQNSQRMLIFASEVFHINENLVKANINPIFLKGPTLAYELNKDLSSRQMVDLDIYVDKKELGKTHKALLDLGYMPTEIPRTQFRKFILKDNYYFHQEKKVSIEIHYRFFPNIYLDKKFKQIFSSLTKSLEIQNRKLQVLSTEANLLFLILHGCNHQWFRLFWLKDLADFISKKEMDWKKIISHSKKLGINNALIQSILLTNIFFDTPIPLKIQNIIKNSKTEKWLLEKAVSAIVSPIDETFSTRFGRLIYLLKICNKVPFKLNTLFGGALRYLGK